MPLDLHRAKPIIWAHRGGRSLAAENTLNALKKAHAAGADGWEIDIVLTKDGIPILLHDLSLMRTTNAICHRGFQNNPPALPWRFTLPEIKQLNAGIFPQRKCGNKVWDNVLKSGPIGPQSTDFAVPTLAEALALSSQLGMSVNIEIKNISLAAPARFSRSIVAQVLQVVFKEKMEEQVYISSFYHPYLKTCKTLAPQIPTGALTEHNFTGNPVALMEKFSINGWNPGHKKLNSEAIDKARNAGLAVNPYTVNSREKMKTFSQWGVTGMVTDYPQYLVELQQNTKYTLEKTIVTP